MENDLERIRSVADYQFGRGVGKALFPKRVKIIRSRRTGRIRYVHLDDKRLVTMRPTDGLFSLSIAGAMLIAERSVKYLVMVKNGVSGFVASGSDVFAVHVAEADAEIRAKDEVIVIDESREVLAVGRALLSGEEMKAFKRGVAVKTRRGTRKVKYNSI